MRFALLFLALGLLALGANSQNYCGFSYEDSKKCQTRCPSATNAECPAGETCFACVECPSNPGSPKTGGSYCGQTYALSKQCRTACPSNTTRECAPGETCFANVACSGSPPATTPDPPTSTDSGLPVSRQQFDQLFPNRDKFYTYAGLVSAADAYPAFMRTGALATRRREAAAFLANIAHESGNLKYIRELNQANWNSYCDERTARQNGFSADCRKRGVLFQYYGRGPIQLSWNFNYLAAGRDFGIDLIHNPDLVATDAAVAWKTAVWFWMRQSGAGCMTPHNAMVSGAGFGETIRSINGALECGGQRPAPVTTRVNFYKSFVRVLGTDVGPGDLRC